MLPKMPLSTWKRSYFRRFSLSTAFLHLQSYVAKMPLKYKENVLFDKIFLPSAICLVKLICQKYHYCNYKEKVLLEKSFLLSTTFLHCQADLPKMPLIGYYPKRSKFDMIHICGIWVVPGAWANTAVLPNISHDEELNSVFTTGSNNT